MDAVGEEVTCPVCQQYFVGATSLQCSHTFCEDCIQKWLTRNNCCPVCRHGIAALEQPTRVRAVDAVVSKLAPLLSPEEQALLQDRQGAFDNRVAAAKKTAAELKKKITKASKGRFLHIGEPWSAEQRKNFVRGTTFYRGEAREVYCAAAGFTKEFIESGSLRELLHACANLSIDTAPTTPPHNASHAAAEKARAEQKKTVRRMLWLFWCWNSRAGAKA